ncbi:putative tail fiber protein [Candidatus Paraburkholderia schumanniana]|nr:putative tail fiber protein [Candidatus Paraburkholderia schumannianae]
MNLHDQLGALESSLDTLLKAAASSARSSAEFPEAATPEQARAASADAPASSGNSAPIEPPALGGERPTPDEPPALNEPPRLVVSRPEQNAIEMTIAGKSVKLSPEGVSELIEELSNVRASMSVDQPTGIAPGWRFAATKNPIMATQKYSNGDRLLILRHGGHGWVPFTFSPNMVIELYAMLTQK